MPIFQNRWIVGYDCSYRCTGFQFRTLTAARKAFSHCTLTDSAYIFTKYSFNPVHAAPFTVDMFRKDRGIV